ncbi:MAG: bifunctional phosphopantothenoylcysteine decarboxylase/phosphopantothenate--cysteine ligase CoaBC [Acidobacteria bacterium]|nr:bifunctional phosphopantothenoylcysteine decarboxylase/phosphopantothenate--cysteine ligase CoaBC [Acidobacteriota bacterium]
MHIALGITGCIAAYKAASIVRELQKRGVTKITPIMTSSAQKLITPLTFEALTNQRAITDQWSPPESREITHISLARSVDALLVAPVTANTIGKFANGIADDFLSTFFMAIEKPVVIAPAMNKEMWSKEAVQKNLDILRERGVHIVDPDSGYLACGEVGAGRLAEIKKIVDTLFDILKPEKILLGKKIVITAGPTREAIDPVRYLSNPSTGKMGYAIAEQAVAMGADVTLISGPVEISPPNDIKMIPVVTALEMNDAVEKSIVGADALIMTAAVADFRPASIATGKIKKDKMPREIKLERNPDILLSLKDNKNIIKVGFAAETENIEGNAKKKLESKGLDMIIANDVSEPGSGFGSDTNRVIMISKKNESESLEMMSKKDVAIVILKKLAGLLL